MDGLIGSFLTADFLATSMMIMTWAPPGATPLHIGSLHAQRCAQRVEDPPQKEGKLKGMQRMCVFIVILMVLEFWEFGMYTLLY